MTVAQSVVRTCDFDAGAWPKMAVTSTGREVLTIAPDLKPA